jgi:outer membrane protein OmpA-like peptidoglycan-associated protein
MQGEPVRVTATPSNFDPKHTLSYVWSTTGGKVAGDAATANVDTTGVAPGSYTASAKITDSKSSKNTASCSANFSVKEQPKNAPQISCSANPATVTAGSPSTVTCTCTSPDNRKVSISNWVASAGKVSGTEGSATLDTAGLQAGPVSVSATCADDRGLTATGNANVNVEVPAAAPEASKLNEIDFKKNSAHVDNKAKAALDDVALRLKSDPEAKAVIVGEYAPGEKVGKKLAAQRAVNAKSYLTQGEAGQGIDATRIDVRTGNGGEMKDENWIVPAGATFKTEGTEPVDEKKVKPNQSFGTSHGAAPAKAKKKAAKKAVAPAQ